MQPWTWWPVVEILENNDAAQQNFAHVSWISNARSVGKFFKVGPGEQEIVYYLAYANLY